METGLLSTQKKAYYTLSKTFEVDMCCLLLKIAKQSKVSCQAKVGVHQVIRVCWKRTFFVVKSRGSSYTQVPLIHGWIRCSRVGLRKFYALPDPPPQNLAQMWTRKICCTSENLRCCVPPPSISHHIFSRVDFQNATQCPWHSRSLYARCFLSPSFLHSTGWVLTIWRRNRKKGLRSSGTFTPSWQSSTVTSRR